MTTAQGTPLLSPHPLGATLPGIYQEDVLVQRLCAALDAVLAPDIVMLDCFPAYLDPATAPPDLLDMLAAWVGLPAARHLPVNHRRALIQRAARLHTWRGTPGAIAALVQAASGFAVELEESGGAGWSQDAGTPLPGWETPGLVVRLRTGGAAIDARTRELLTQLLELVVPAHLPWRLESGG